MSFRCQCCGKNSTLQCSKCKRVYYCSKECQLRDWPTHKTVCGKHLKDYSSAIARTNDSFLQTVRFEQTEDVSTVYVPIPAECRRNSVQVEMGTNSISINVVDCDFSTSFELSHPIKTSESSWTFSDGELILCLRKSTPSIWKSLFPVPSSTDLPTQSVQFPYIVYFLRSTNRLHIVIQNETNLTISSISFSVAATDETNALKPISTLTIRFCDQDRFYSQDIRVAALIDSKDGSCYIEKEYFVVDLNVKRFDEIIDACRDLIDHSLYMECSTLSKSITHLSCSRCLHILTLPTLKQAKRSPSSLWSDLREQIYCNHDGHTHLHSHLDTKGVLRVKGTAFVRPSSLLFHPADLQTIREESKSAICESCGNRLGIFIDDNEPDFVVEIWKDKLSLEKTPFYSTTKRLMTQLLDWYRQKSFTRFNLQCKKHCLLIQIMNPLVFLQFSTEEKQPVHQGMQFSLIHDLTAVVDITMDVQLADLLNLKQSILKATLASPEICTVNHSSYYFIYCYVYNKHMI